MPQQLIARIGNFINRLEQLLLRQNGPLPAAAFSLVGNHGENWTVQSGTKVKRLSLKDLLGDRILWAVPKHRRTVEKRLSRKFGYPEYVWKPLKLKTRLRSCNQCGHDYEVGVLCPQCYNKVREETKQIQNKIQEKLGLEPIEQEVIVLYESEKAEQPKELLNSKRIVEMSKPRPMWFSKNLLQKSTQQPATSEVKPSNLG